MLKKFKDLSEKEILALAIASEEEDSRIFGEFADALRETYPATAKMFEEMRAEEVVHRDRLLAMFRQRFGDHIPLIRRENVKGFLQRRPTWLVRPLGVNVARKQAKVMEMEAARFYSRAVSRITDAPTRELLNKLADEERKHEATADGLEEKHLTEPARAQEDESHRKLFLLQVVQPGLLGLIDGSISTLAPLFATAFATHKSGYAFSVGLAASIGAGISMGFSEISIRRRLADGTRFAVAARNNHGTNDNRRRHRTHVAISHRQFPRSYDSGFDCGGHRTYGD